MNIAPLHSYRVPIVRDLAAYTGIDEHTETIRVRAASAIHAALCARWVTGAAVALEPQRIVQAPAQEAAHG